MQQATPVPEKIKCPFHWMAGNDGETVWGKIMVRKYFKFSTELFILLNWKHTESELTARFLVLLNWKHIWNVRKWIYCRVIHFAELEAHRNWINCMVILSHIAELEAHRNWIDCRVISIAKLDACRIWNDFGPDKERSKSEIKQARQVEERYKFSCCKKLNNPYNLTYLSPFY